MEFLTRSRTKQTETAEHVHMLLATKKKNNSQN